MSEWQWFSHNGNVYRFNTVTGRAWVLDRDEWILISEPETKRGK